MKNLGKFVIGIINTMKNLGMFVIVIIGGFMFLYGVYWVAKHGSYWLWYDDMVKTTVQEMVKPEALKGR